MGLQRVGHVSNWTEPKGNLAVQHVTLWISSALCDSIANKADVIFPTSLFIHDPLEAVPFGQDYVFALREELFIRQYN